MEINKSTRKTTEIKEGKLRGFVTYDDNKLTQLKFLKVSWSVSIVDNRYDQHDSVMLHKGESDNYEEAVEKVKIIIDSYMTLLNQIEN